MPRTSRAWLIAVLLLAVSSASAQDADPPEKKRQFRLFGTLNSFFEDNQTARLDDIEDGDYQKFRQLIDLNLAWSKFSFGLQLEYLWWSDIDLVDPGDLDRVREGFEVRKYWAEYLGKSVNARLGTFFTSFGRGLTLYVQRNEIVGLDEPVHGGNLTVKAGPLELTALGGKVHEPLLEAQFNRRFEDTVWGGRAVARLPLDFFVGASYVGARMEPIIEGAADDEAEVWSLEAGSYELAGYLDIYGEWAEISKIERGRDKDGWGRYFSVSSTVGALTLLGEYKDYWNFAYRYNNPPTAGPTTEAYDHNDTKGPRLLINYDIASTGTLLGLSYGDFNSQRRPESLGGEGGDRQVEWLLSLEERTPLIFLDMSYFNRDFVDRNIVEEHVNAELHITTLGGRGDINPGFDQRKETLEHAAVSYTRSHLTFSMSPWGSIGLRYSWNDRSNLPREDFWGGDIEFFPIRAITLGLFVGSDPGGLVCSGGQCRIEPPFKGARARFSWRFR